MAIVIEAIYENGVLKPLDTERLKEHHRYRLITEEIEAPETQADPQLGAELERRTTILLDGRRIVNLAGILAGETSPILDGEDPIAEALGDLRRSRAAQFEGELGEHFPTSSEP